MQRVLQTCGGIFLIVAALDFASETAKADVIYSVTINTQALKGQTGPFALDFQFTDGTGSGDQNNTVTLSNFSFVTGGGPLLVFPFGPTGGVAQGSSLSSQVKITDSAGFNEFSQNFTPGSNLSFTLDLTTNPEKTQTQSDQFSFAILQNGLNIPTFNLDGSETASDTFLLAMISRSGIGITTAGSNSQVPGGFNIPTPQALLVPQASVSVPEPATLFLFLLGAASMTLTRRRCR